MRETFMDLLLSGRVRPKDIGRYIEEWHKSNDEESHLIYEYLGMTRSQYADWVEDPSTLEKYHGSIV